MDALDIAIQHGQLDTVKLLIADKSLDIISSKLNIASRYNQLQIAEYLLQNGASVNYNEYRCLTDATKAGNLEFVKLFMHNGGQDIHISSNGEYRSYYIPIYVAIKYKHVHIFEYLLNFYNPQNPGYQTVIDKGLRFAVSYGQLYMVKSLIEKGAHIRVNINSFLGRSPLEIAVYNNHPEIVEYLICLSENIDNICDELLGYACCHNDINTLRMLVEPQKYIRDCPPNIQGIDIHVNEQYTIKMATSRDNLQAIQYLISQGINIPLD